MKRVIAVLLACLLVLPLCMVTVFAADTGYSFTFLEDFTDVWDVFGDNIPDGRYMVEWWMDDILCAYSNPFEYEKENCTSRWSTTIVYYSPYEGLTLEGNLYILYNPNDDKMVVTVPDPCSFDAVDTPTVDVRFVPITPESPERLFLSFFEDGLYYFVAPGPFESGVYTFVLRAAGVDNFYRTEPVTLSFKADPNDPYGQIATAETNLIIEDQSLPIALLAFFNKDYHAFSIGLGMELNGPIYVEVERTAVTDGEDVSVVNQLSTVANSFFGTIGRIAEKIVSEPLLLLTVGIFFIGGCIAIFARFLRRE